MKMTTRMFAASILLVAVGTATNLFPAVMAGSNLSGLGSAVLAQENYKTGTIKYINTVKGFGYVTMDSTGQDIIFKTSDLLDEIDVNARVKFKLVNGKKGVSAVEIKLLPED